MARDSTGIFINFSLKQPLRMLLMTGIDSLLITNPTNVRYLTGFVGAAPEEREAYVLQTRNQLYLFTNALYLEQAKKIKATVVEISRENPFATKLAEILTRAGPVKRLGFEENDLTVAEYHKIMHVHKNVILVPTKGRIEELRMMKRDDEIENIRAAARLTDQCFGFILGKLKPGLPAEASAKVGVSENKIAWEIESFIRNRGAQLAFSPIVAFGAHASQPHYLTGPGLVKTQGLAPPELVLLDFGAKINGYCSDMTRVVFVGKPKDEWKRAYETVLTAQQKALEYLTGPGPVTSTADRIARKVIEKAGFPAYPHSLGHGVGLDIHEAPRLTINPSTRSARSGLQPGMVVTIEPGIYIEGQYGIRIEDLVHVTNTGIEILSHSKKEMTIL